MHTQEQAEAMIEAFESHEHVHSTAGEFGGGMMGDRITVYLEGTDAPNFGIHVEDIDLNCEWDIVAINRGTYVPHTPDDCDLVLEVEVRRFPDV